MSKQAKPIYQWKTVTSTIKLGKRASKDMIYTWFKSLPQKKQQAILDDICRGVA